MYLNQNHNLFIRIRQYSFCFTQLLFKYEIFESD